MRASNVLGVRTIVSGDDLAEDHDRRVAVTAPLELGRHPPRQAVSLVLPTPSRSGANIAEHSRSRRN
jgi:hypothetical protein